MLTIEIDRGASLSPPFQSQRQDGTPETVFLASDVLTARVWAGQDQATLLTPAASWIDAPTARFTVAFTDADTAGLEVATYRLQVKAARSGHSAVVADCLLKINPSPGSSAPPTVYCTYQDLLDRARWVGKLQGASDTAGFLSQRGRARAWFDDILQRHYRAGAGSWTDFDYSGIGYGGYGSGIGRIFRPGTRSAQLQGWLDAGRLDVTAQVIDAVAAWSIALAARDAVNPLGKDESPYKALAREFAAEAEAACAGITAEIDSNGDGINDVSIRLGIADTLEG